MAEDSHRPAPTRAVDDPILYRRSLRASRARRAIAAKRARRVVRGRRSLVATVVAMTTLTGGAFAASTAPATRSAATTSVVAAAQRALGIPADGVVGPQTRRAVRRFQERKGLAVDGVIGPQTLAALGIRGGSTARTSPTAAKEAARSTDAPALLEAIALCESGGDPTRVSASGRYRGKYQFDRATWRSVGGTGDPAAAPEAEQDARAATLMQRRGPDAWPACAEKVGAAG